MLFSMRGRFAAAAFIVSLSETLLAFTSPALAQGQGGAPIVLPDIVVTPMRGPSEASRSGTAISVITREEIEKFGGRDIGDLLRLVPGVTVGRNGGPGQSQFVRIRGAESRHTLVLIDGIRINDPISTGRELDFANLVLANVERIEVLRGPQSALYGSDAIGGVINIITRRGGNMKPQSSLTVEAGRYATKEVRGGVVGGDERADFAFGFSGLDTAGFSAFGYRIGRLRRFAPWGFEPDSAQRAGVSGRVGVNVADWLRVEYGGQAFFNKAQFDAAFGAFPDTPSIAESQFGNIYSRLIADTFDNQLRNTVTVFANKLDRTSDGVSYFGPAVRPSAFESVSRFVGTRTGAEYQGDLKLGGFGTFTYGTKVEREMADTFARGVLPVLTAEMRDVAAEQVTRSAFALIQSRIGENLNVSLGGRIDNVIDVDTFRTWRATAACFAQEADPTLRSSIGTGGKAPSLFQLYSDFGTPSLQSETSWGADGGVDHVLFGGRAKVSTTIFYNRFKNLIDFATNAKICSPFQFFGCYFNIARAQTAGVEIAGTFVLVEDRLRLRTTYTFLEAIDLATELKLPRRPGKEARIGLEVLPVSGLSIEPAVVLVGDRFSSPGMVDRLPSYARLDVYSSYKINQTFEAFIRAENLANINYEEVKNFGTSGRAFYGGVRATW
jgi:vitamin B12 transporter